MSLFPIPIWTLYGEKTLFPDILHVEYVVDRAAGLDWTIAAHRHLGLHQLFLLTSGTIDMTLDGDPLSVLPPAVINIPRGTVHSFSFSAGTEGLVLTLPADDFPDLFAAPAETAAALSKVFVLTPTPDIVQRFKGLAQTYAASAPYRRTLLRAEATGLAAKVSDRASQTLAPRAAPDPRLQEFEALVRASIGQPFSLPSMARAMSLSPRSLSRLCKAETGMTAHEFFEAQRMREACRLLVYTRMTAQQIAYHLGFDDPSYFSRVFQRTMNQSPTAYRNRFDR